jgi:signal transduction histidine kinase
MADRQGANRVSTILVVDGRDDSLASTRALLGREGHRVLTATSGEEALGILKDHEIQLVLVDYGMPGISAPELIQAIRVSDPYVQIILRTNDGAAKPPLALLTQLDIQGYHSRGDGPDALLMWVAVGLKAHRLISTLVERERVQADLVANVSHEFRTPLNIIGGYAQLLLEGTFGTIPEEAIPVLRTLTDTNRSLGELVNNFLQYARADAGVSSLQSDAVTTSQLAQELRRLGIALLEEKPVTFKVNIDAAPRSFASDSVKLRTILRNLIVNAAKFTTEGEVALEISTKDAILVFRVRDTGPGIPPDQLETVFEPFRQLDSSSTRAHGGVGLGLALSRRLARLLGGKLEVESELGVGAVFTLSIPVGPSATRASAVSGRQST